MCLNYAEKLTKKLSVLARLTNFMSIKQRRLLRKFFIGSQLGCCPLIWMFHGTGVNNKINHLDERSLHIVYKDNKSSSKELLKKDNSFIVYHRNIQSLAIELFKVKENLSNTIMNDIFQTRALTYILKVTIRFCAEFCQH